MVNAYRDGNDVPTLIGVSSADGQTPLRVYVNPATHRVLVDNGGGSSGITVLVATGAVNGTNAAFTFTKEPSYIVSDHGWYAPINSNGTTNWTWNAGTLTATMTIPPTEDIFGVQ